jgi:hypothetical protein
LDQIRYFIKAENFYGATCFYEAIDEEPTLLKDYIKEHGVVVNGRPYIDLVNIVKKDGTDEQIDEVFALDPVTPNTGLVELGRHGRIDAVKDEIRTLYKEYTEKHGLTTFPPIFLEHVNAAVELQSQYDAVIGILRKGAPVPNLMHALGQKVGMIEFHQNWLRGAMWRRIGGEKFTMDQGGKILICEDDAVRGRTLRSVLSRVDEFNPSKVDVCFTGVMYSMSRSAADNIGVFDKVFHCTEVSQDHVFTNHLKIRDVLKEKMSV